MGQIDTAVLVGIVAIVAAVLAFLVGLWALMRTRRLARLSRFQPEMPTDLEARINRDSSRLDGVSAIVNELQARLPLVEQRSLNAVQHVGVVRFNPFEDTGGQQSFALALLDEGKSGVVISSLHSRAQTRVYLKHVDHGRCETALSEEETEALRRAGANVT